MYRDSGLDWVDLTEPWVQGTPCNNRRPLLGALANRNLQPSKIAENIQSPRCSIKRPIVGAGRRHSACRWHALL